MQSSSHRLPVKREQAAGLFACSLLFRSSWLCATASSAHVRLLSSLHTLPHLTTTQTHLRSPPPSRKNPRMRICAPVLHGAIIAVRTLTRGLAIRIYGEPFRARALCVDISDSQLDLSVTTPRSSPCSHPRRRHSRSHLARIRPVLAVAIGPALRARVLGAAIAASHTPLSPAHTLGTVISTRPRTHPWCRHLPPSVHAPSAPRLVLHWPVHGMNVLSCS
ncbi:hypothetical protein FB451DRAFT_1551320 [Mycena latifolia]|nr:hypothetical protein FB451DRAFT_1551320 [Mycena latifolia]